jgi:hypothetical protein
MKLPACLAGGTSLRPVATSDPKRASPAHKGLQLISQHVTTIGYYYDF